MKKKSLLFKGAFLLFAGLQLHSAHAQQKIGGAVGAADANAYLQLGDATGAKKGLLLSRVALTATNAAGPLTAHVAGMVVYNTATAGTGATAVTPGYYYNDGTQWVRIAATNDIAAKAWLPGGNKNGALQTLGTNDNFDLPFATNGTEKMRLSAAGNLGIGNTTPQSPLDFTAADGRKISFNVAAPNDNQYTGFGLGDGGYSLINQLRGPQSFFKWQASNYSDASTELMRLTGNGYLGIGMQNPSVPLQVKGGFLLNKNGTPWNVTLNGGTSPEDGLIMNAFNDYPFLAIQATGGPGLYVTKSAVAEGESYVQFSVNGQSVGSISAATTNSIAFNTTSDVRLKENIVSSKYGLQTIMKMKTYDYNYKSDKAKALSTGVLAQELNTLFPQAVTVGGADAATNPWQVDYSKIVPVLVKGIQDQQAEIESLQKEQQAQKAEIEALKAAVQALQNK
jgi:hypothetical protein